MGKILGMSNFVYALQLIILLTVVGTAADSSNIRSAWAQEAEVTSESINSTEQTCLLHARCTEDTSWNAHLVALEVIGKSSDIEKNKCMDTGRRLNMEQQFGNNGVISKPSKYPVKETMNV